MTTQVVLEPGSYQSFEELLAPTAPFDDHSFDQLKTTYNFQQTSDWVRLFVRLLIKECKSLPKPSRVLDIGCGVGIARSPDMLKAVRQHIDELWGLEPDPSVKGDPALFTNFQNATMETANLPENHFDLAFSFMVMEHVADPIAYLNAVHRCLKPGGVHFFMTVNGHHYFTRAALAMKRMKVDEALLRILRGKHVEDYHYPVQYRCNKPAVVERLASQTGFTQTEFVFIEEQGPKPYFPGPLKPFWMLMQWKRKMFRNPRALLTLVVRMKKPAITR